MASILLAVGLSYMAFTKLIYSLNIQFENFYHRFWILLNVFSVFFKMTYNFNSFFCCCYCNMSHWSVGILPSLDIWNQFSSVMSNSLRPHELQHTRPPCPSPTPGVLPNPCPSSWWCHPTISSSVVPFSSCPQSFPASGSFQMSQLFASAGRLNKLIMTIISCFYVSFHSLSQ